MKGIFNKYKKHIPNILTTLRLVAVPVFWVLTLTGNFLPATILFGSACITDALDGFLARRWEVESIYGKLVDPFADKLLVMSALLLNGITLSPVMLIPFALESGIAIVNIKDFMKNVDVKKLLNKEYIEQLIIEQNKVKVSQTGREKTIALMSTVSLGLLNNSLNLSIDKVIKVLTLLTGTMEAATLSEYIDVKILKNDSHMRMPEFVKEKEEIKEDNKEVTKELSNTEKLEILNNEKEFLTKSGKNKNIVKKEKIHKP